MGVASSSKSDSLIVQINSIVLNVRDFDWGVGDIVYSIVYLQSNRVIETDDNADQEYDFRVIHEPRKYYI